jgi:hypothetical protein
MKSIIFAAALMTAGAAIAQETQAPGNSAPERDARGIAVISAPATPPAGTNEAPPPVAPGQVVTVNPNQSAAFAPTQATGDMPPCTATVTDHCTQTYEGGHGTRHRRHR